MSWINVSLRGREQHCGTTPLDKRADTLLAAAHMITRANAVAHSLPGTLASVAVINSSPQSINTLAGSVQFTIDARARDDEKLERLVKALQEACNEEASKSGVKLEKWDRFWTAPETVFDEKIVGFVRAAADENGYKWREIQSGAGHDS